MTLDAMTFAQYRQIDAVNWSSLREMRRSPAHYRYRLDHPREDTTGLAFGRGLHAAALEPDRLPLEFAVFKGARRAGKDWQAFRAVHGEDTILKASEYERCLAIRDAVRAHPTASKYLRAGRAERAITWVDRATGLHCKGRLDWISDSVPALVDLKGTSDLSRLHIVAAQFGYNCQLAFYLAGLRALGLEVPARIVAVEVQPPHAVQVLALHDDDLYAGERECAELLRKVADCTARRSWPAGAGDEQVLRVPAWSTCRLREQDDLSGLGLVARKVG